MRRLRGSEGSSRDATRARPLAETRRIRKNWNNLRIEEKDVWLTQRRMAKGDGARPVLRPMSRWNGAPDGSILEPNMLPSVLEKLEEWDQELKHSHELILRLRELSSASASDDRLTKNPVDKPVPPRGPKRSGPSL